MLWGFSPGGAAAALLRGASVAHNGAAAGAEGPAGVRPEQRGGPHRDAALQHDAEATRLLLSGSLLSCL